MSLLLYTLALKRIYIKDYRFIIIKHLTHLHIIHRDMWLCKLHFQATNCAYTTREDIAYWGIDELLVEPCCAVKYYSDIEICIKELDTEEEEKQREIEREKIEDFGPTWYGKLRKKLWDLFEYPQTSKGAKVCSSYHQYQQNVHCTL